jgi:dTDP-glucose pyrophosphorylase
MKAEDSVLNVVIPMAGEGSRFASAGYELPKPFIDVDGYPMIERVIENLAYPGARYILIVQERHLEAHLDLFASLSQSHPIDIVPIDVKTEGSACTVLFARGLINNASPLLIANCDQLVDGGIQEMVDDCKRSKFDGSIMVFDEPGRDGKWSYVKLDTEGHVSEAREKIPISSLATVGIYLFSKGADFVDAAIEMILLRDRTNNEYYTCPVYNYCIRNEKKIGIYEITSDAMHGIGTPDDLSHYLRLIATKG